MTHILVTGAAGFIGSHLCEALLEQGHVVRGLDAFTTFYDPQRKRGNLEQALAHPSFTLVTGDLLTAPLDEALDGVEWVAHLAGEPGVSTSWGPSFARYVDRNVLATQRLLEAAVENGVQRLVYASSSSVYGGEADALRAQGEPRPYSPYGVSKLAAETLVGAYALSHGLPTVSLRYFSVYGPRQRPDMAAHRFIESLLDGRPLNVFGDGSQVRDFTYVGDVVAATIRALSADLPRAAVLDVASGRPTAVGTLIGLLNELVGAGPASIVQCDERLGDVPRTEGNTSTAQQHLGWSAATDLRTGLTRQLEWHASLREDAEQGDLTLLPSAGA
ncbi:MAG TPA: NAD-dependent epimerase/dehydratase family protein [Pedococcus sp.]|nr:NAD-dependent epimerase/dehydratase family protein [Pedococcus sp.]